MMKLFEQIIKFSFVSLIGWIIDFILYTLLTSIFKINIDVANMISSFCGVTFVFLMSTMKIFKNNHKINIFVKYVIYIIYQIILIFLASKVMLLLKDYILSMDIEFVTRYVNILVKIMITPFTLLINFIVMKYLNSI